MFTATLITHKEQKRIAVYFDKKDELIERFKKLPGARWSATLKCWHLPDNEAYRKQFNIEATTPTEETNAKPEWLKTQQYRYEASKHIESFKRYLRSKRYSTNTIKTYTDALYVFLSFFNGKQPEDIENNDIITFNNEYIFAKKLSASYQNQMVNAVKLFFNTVINKKIELEKVHRPKREKALPNVLSKEEVKKILEAPRNLKHKTMLSLIYSCGLRCGELLALKPEHVDSKRKLLIIKNAKGGKDRIVPLSEKILEMLRLYYRANKPKTFLFEGQFVGRPYDARSLQQVLKLSINKAGIYKPVTLHWLRHSYATHLLENGIDLRYIQELLGHNSSRTTEIYTHVSTKNLQKIVSPFDYL
ncbi:MAG: site-specific integrase [Bacteroidetes bacterium]|nr:site-specific integrase [Bacteroidota bacterium]